MGETGPLLGATLELTVGAVAHGGSCVARYPDADGRVVFVRHALPGEQVRAVVTEDRGGAYCFADAVDILAPSGDRVEPPCPYAGPGRCGGCDWQHADAAAQRRLKGDVVRDQFARLARLDVGDIAVEELPGGLLGWRTRNLYAVDRHGRPGMRVHRSHEVVPVERCLIGAEHVGDAAALADTWPGLTGVEAARGAEDADVALLAHRPGRGRPSRGRRPPDRVRVLTGPSVLHHRAVGRTFQVASGGFWQVHPYALDAFAAALLDGVRPAAGETVLDLYAGAGPLTAALADAVGPTGLVLGVESAPDAVADAEQNLADLPHATVRRDRITPAVLTDLGIRPDVVVLDPPRTGAGREVMAALLALAPRVVGYVACDPAALARDVATALGAGWQLDGLRAFDAFPMTHHVECVAVLAPRR